MVHKWDMTMTDLAVDTPIGIMYLKHTRHGNISVSFENGRTLGVRVVSQIVEKNSPGARFVDAKRNGYIFEFSPDDGAQVIYNGVHVATINMPQPLVVVAVSEKKA